MFEYFDDNYWWSLMVVNSLGQGGELSEIDRACAPLRGLSADRVTEQEAARWTRAWIDLGSHVARLAGGDAEGRLSASASRKYLRAANYLLIGEMMLRPGSAERAAAYDDALRAFRAGIELSSRPVEFVEVQFEGTTLPALFVPASRAAAQPAPCMIHFDGTHDVKEVTYLRHRHGAADRGISLLIVDHPGSGGALRLGGLFARPDIETAATACVDYLEGRRDVDADAIGIVAQSFGGYYAPRAAAFEKRLKVCIVWGAIWDAYEARLAFDGNFEPDNWWLLGLETREQVIARLREFTLEGGVIERVECPLLVLHGENDRQCALSAAQKTFARATGSSRRELRVFRADEGGDQHCQADMFSMATDYIHDWLAEFFGTNAR